MIVVLVHILIFGYTKFHQHDVYCAPSTKKLSTALLHVMIRGPSLPLKISEIIIYGFVKKYVKLSPVSWTMFLSDLALVYKDRS